MLPSVVRSPAASHDHLCTMQPDPLKALAHDVRIRHHSPGGSLLLGQAVFLASRVWNEEEAEINEHPGPSGSAARIRTAESTVPPTTPRPHRRGID